MEFQTASKSTVPMVIRLRLPTRETTILTATNSMMERRIRTSMASLISMKPIRRESRTLATLMVTEYKIGKKMRRVLNGIIPIQMGEVSMTASN